MKHTARVLLVLFFVSLASGGCRAGGNRRLEEFVERWRLLYNSHDLAGFTALYAPRGTYMAPGMIYFATSPEKLRPAIELLWRAYPDIRIAEVYSVVAGDDQVAFAWKMTRTRPRGKAAEVLRGTTFLILEDGLVVHQMTMTSR